MEEKDNIEESKQKKFKYIVITLIANILMVMYFSIKMDVYKFEEATKIITYIMTFTLMLITELILIYIFNKKELKPEKIFLIIGIPFCILFCLTMPLSKGHDETIHGLRVYEYVEGTIVNNGESVYLQKGVIKALENKNGYTDISLQKDIYSSNTEKIKYESRMASYSPITYLPQIIGINISKIFTHNSLIQFYVARIFNIITCITILYFAIKKIPFGKNLILLISLIPIAIEGYATLSADGITIASCILFISYVLNLAYGQKERINTKQIIFLSILSIIVAISKIVYLPLILLLLIIPKEKFKNKYIQVFAIFMISAIIDIIWYSLRNYFKYIRTKLRSS